MRWNIVGGGPHGVHLAVMLRERGVPLSDIKIFDPAPELLTNWRSLTARVGMRHLRSPIVHHVGAHPNALWRFWNENREHFSREDLLVPYNLPSLALFNAHLQSVVEANELHRCHERAIVDEDALDDLAPSRVVLALGGAHAPRMPEWSTDRTRHIFSAGQRVAPRGGRVVVVGGGITAAQVSLRWATEGARVTMVHRGVIAVRPFDTAADWMGPKRLEPFWRSDLDARTEALGTARFLGTMPHERRTELMRAHERGELEVICADRPSDALLEEADEVICCTGFENVQAPLIRALMSRGLPAHRGRPVVDETLQWRPGLFVTGAAAELQLGPACRNLLGARWAARRILDA